MQNLKSHLLPSKLRMRIKRYLRLYTKELLTNPSSSQKNSELTRLSKEVLRQWDSCSSTYGGLTEIVCFTTGLIPLRTYLPMDSEIVCWLHRCLRHQLLKSSETTSAL